MKKFLITVLIVILVIVMIPIRVQYKDGGSGGWHAIAWQYTKYHKIGDVGGTYLVGTKVTLFGSLTVFDNTHIEVLND